jgi:hypothetical protein
MPDSQLRDLQKHMALTLADMGVEDGKTLGDVQRRLHVDAPTAMRLFSLLNAVKGLPIDSPSASRERPSVAEAQDKLRQVFRREWSASFPPATKRQAEDEAMAALIAAALAQGRAEAQQEIERLRRIIDGAQLQLQGKQALIEKLEAQVAEIQRKALDAMAQEAQEDGLYD